MEYTVPVNEILSEEITKLSNTLIPAGFRGDVRNARLLQTSLSKLIDWIGEQSSTAQGLNKIITTAEKFRNSQNQVLYLLKDDSAKHGKGEVIGLLKVGWKHLFLFDQQEKVCEVEPLCVLDFFVLPNRQRHGYGKILFDHMLKDMKKLVSELAIDGPSPKMEHFLRKNYGVKKLLWQNNNFAVSMEFFSTVFNKSGRNSPVVTTAVGRFAALKPQSVIGNVIHGDNSPFQTSDNGTTSGAVTPEPELNVALNALKMEHKEANSNQDPLPMTSREADEPKTEELVLINPDCQKNNERPSTLKVEPVSGTAAPPLSPAGSVTPRRDSQLNERGFFDVKFYHNKLW